MANTILLEQWYKNRKDNFNYEKVRIISTARNLNTNEIRCIWYETNVNPSKGDIESGAKFLPPTLNILMEVLLGQGLKKHHWTNVI